MKVETKTLDVTVMHGKTADSYYLFFCYPGEINTVGEIPVVITIDKRQAELFCTAYGIEMYEY